MRVQFNYEQKDMVDAALRFLRRSKAVRSWRWKGAILIMLASIGLAMTGRVPVPLLLVLAGIAGALIY